MKKTLRMVIILSLFAFTCIISDPQEAYATRDSATQQEFLEYANAAVGKYYPNGWCLKFVSDFFAGGYGDIAGMGFPGAYGMGDAYSCWCNNVAQHYGDWNIPIGADVFFDGWAYYWDSDIGQNVWCQVGHIGIYVGDGIMLEASGNTVNFTSMSDCKTYRYDHSVGVQYLGWGWHPNVSIDSTPPSPALPDGDYIITTAADTHYYLDIVGGDYPAAGETNVQLYYSPDGNVSDIDAWTLHYNGNGYYRISQYHQNVSLDVYNESTANEANVQVWYNNDTSAQQWRITGSSSSGYRIQAQCSGKYLEYADSILAAETNVQQWAYADVPAQYWMFIPYTSSYTVTYDANGGKNPPSAQTKMSGADLTLSSVRPTRDSVFDGGCTVYLDANGGTVSPASKIVTFTRSYSFNFWNTSPNGNGTNYMPGSTYSKNENVTLYAQWHSLLTPNEITLPNPTRDGYVALGWADSATATTARYSVGSSYKATNTTTLYAVWKQNGNTIHYNANGGENPPADQFKRVGETITLSPDIPTRRGYTFLGWGTSASAATPTYQPGDRYSANADLTLYALWRITNPPTLRAKDVSMLVGDTRNLSDFVELTHDGVLSYTLTATAGGTVRVDGQNVTAAATGNGALIVSVAEYPAATCTVNIRVVDLNNMLRLPAALTTIEEEAFANCGAAAVTLPSGCESIGSRAFADNAELVYIFIPAGVTNISYDAFANSPNVTIYCYPGSMAAMYAESHSIRYVLLSDDWVSVDNVPVGARITARKWTYTSREYAESSSASYTGWTRYDSKTSWTGWSEWQNTEISTSSNREVRTQTVITGYNMITYCVSGPNGRSYQPSPTYTVRLQHGPYWWSKAEFDSAVVFPAGSYFDYDSNVAGYVLDGTAYCKWDGSDTGGYVPMFIQDTSYGTQWSYRDAVHTYYYYRDLNKESATDPSGQDNVSNVQEWVKYTY